MHERLDRPRVAAAPNRSLDHDAVEAGENTDDLAGVTIDQAKPSAHVSPTLAAHLFSCFQLRRGREMSLDVTPMEEAALGSSESSGLTSNVKVTNYVN